MNSKGITKVLTVVNAAACSLNILDFLRTKSLVSLVLGAVCGYLLWRNLSALTGKEQNI